MAERSLADVVAEINEVKTRKKITEKELKQLDSAKPDGTDPAFMSPKEALLRNELNQLNEQLTILMHDRRQREASPPNAPTGVNRLGCTHGYLSQRCGKRKETSPSLSTQVQPQRQSCLPQAHARTSWPGLLLALPSPARQPPLSTLQAAVSEGYTMPSPYRRHRSAHSTDDHAAVVLDEDQRGVTAEDGHSLAYVHLRAGAIASGASDDAHHRSARAEGPHQLVRNLGTFLRARLLQWWPGVEADSGAHRVMVAIVYTLVMLAGHFVTLSLLVWL